MKSLKIIYIAVMLFATTLYTSVAFAQTTYNIPVGLNVESPGTMKVIKTFKPIKPIPTNKRFDMDIKIPKTEDMVLKNSFPTTNTAVFKAVEYPVYATKNGKLFFVMYSEKSGNYYRKYIKTDP